MVRLAILNADVLSYSIDRCTSERLFFFPFVFFLLVFIFYLSELFCLPFVYFHYERGSFVGYALIV